MTDRPRTPQRPMSSTLGYAALLATLMFAVQTIVLDRSTGYALTFSLIFGALVVVFERWQDRRRAARRAAD